MSGCVQQAGIVSLNSLVSGIPMSSKLNHLYSQSNCSSGPDISKLDESGRHSGPGHLWQARDSSQWWNNSTPAGGPTRWAVRQETLKQICVSWNKGQCSFPVCNFRNICATCKRKGHRAKDCDDTPADSSYKTAADIAHRPTSAPIGSRAAPGSSVS